MNYANSYRAAKERLTDLLEQPIATPLDELFEIAADALERKDRLIVLLSDDLKRERETA